MADNARIGIILTHILNNNRQGAINYFESEMNRFRKTENLNKADLLINDSKEGLKFNHYYELYK